MSQPSYEELAELVIALRAHIAVQDARIADQDARIAELERQLGANSRNSSKPPSTDGLAKPAPKSLRKKSGRKSGGQPGRRGRTLEQVSEPDEVIRHEPRCCAGCGADARAGVDVGATRRQVFDLPSIRIRVTEHQLISRRCGCGRISTGTAPAGVGAPVQYGPRILAVMVYLYMGQYLSRSRTAKAMSELFSTPVSEGTVSAATAAAGDDLEEFTEQVADRIAGGELAHFDETGFRVQGKLAWLHSASTSMFSLITCHPRRGRKRMNAAGVLPNFSGVAVHDAWAPYDTYPKITHALCNAHVLRELIAVTDHHTATATDPASWCWAQQVIDALLAIKALTDTGPVPIDPTVLARNRTLITHAARIAASGAGPGKVEQKHRALARRITTRIEDYLRFAVNPIVPFDNNAAEREVRMAKLRQKISGSIAHPHRRRTLRRPTFLHRNNGQTRPRHTRRAHHAHHPQPLAARNYVTSYAVATGKVLLASLPDYELRALPHEPFEGYTANGMPNFMALQDELARIRQQGFAINNGSWRHEVVGVAQGPGIVVFLLVKSNLIGR